MQIKIVPPIEQFEKEHFNQNIYVRYLGIRCSYYSKGEFLINFQNSMIFLGCAKNLNKL